MNTNVSFQTGTWYKQNYCTNKFYSQNYKLKLKLNITQFCLATQSESN